MTVAMPGLAAAVQSARRALGETQSAVEGRFGLDPGVVGRVELGEDVPEVALRAVLEGLRIDPAPYLRDPSHASTDVRAVDDDHARTMALLLDVAQVRDGWLALPDVAAVPPVPGWSPEALADAGRDVDAWRPVRPSGTRWAFPVVVGGCGMSVLSELGRQACEGVPGLHVVFATTESAFAASSVAAMCLIVARTSRGKVVNPHAAAHTRLVLLGLEEGSRSRKVAEMARHGFAVSSWGVTAYEVTPKGVETRELPASAFRSVTCRDAGEGHVTVSLDTILGPLEMPWLRATADLRHLVGRWSERARSPGPMLEGPQ